MPICVTRSVFVVFGIIKPLYCIAPDERKPDRKMLSYESLPPTSVLPHLQLQNQNQVHKWVMSPEGSATQLILAVVLIKEYSGWIFLRLDHPALIFVPATGYAKPTTVPEIHAKPVCCSYISTSSAVFNWFNLWALNFLQGCNSYYSARLEWPLQPWYLIAVVCANLQEQWWSQCILHLYIMEPKT